MMTPPASERACYVARSAMRRQPTTHRRRDEWGRGYHDPPRDQRIIHTTRIERIMPTGMHNIAST